MDEINGKEKTPPKTSAEVAAEWAVKVFPTPPVELPRVLLETLEAGSRFWLADSGRKGTLLYVTPGRARVRYDKEFVDANSDYAIDIAPRAVVVRI